MSKMKKVLLMCTAYVLVAALAIGGTIAYLTSEDSDVNVMTLGNVSIAQHEYERATKTDGSYETKEIDGVTSYELKEFTQAKPLYPATEIDANGNPYNYGAGDYGPTRVKMSQVDSHGSMDVFVNENAIDKFVTVENTGKTDAYVRTIIAMEIGSLTEARFDEVIKTSSFMTAQGVWKVTDIGIVEIGGNNYYIIEYVYNGAKALGGVHENGVLPAGDTTYPSLAQVYMTGSATNEDVEKIDGNNNGTYDILVLSQAVQAAGFENAQTALDTAFGKSSEKAAEWFGGITIPNVLASVTAVHASTNKNGTFVLADDIVTSGDASVASSSRYGYGYEYIVRGGVDYTLDLNGKTIAHKAVNENANNDAFTYLFVANNAGTKLTINGDGKVYANNSEGYTCAIQGKDGTLITVNGGDYEVDNGIAVWAGAGSHIVINGGSFVNGANGIDHELVYSSGGVVDIYGGFFHNTDHNNMTLNIEDRNRATGFINIYGGTFVNYDPSSDTRRDPDNIKVADGYKVVSETQANGDVWYTVVAE